MKKTFFFLLFFLSFSVFARPLQLEVSAKSAVLINNKNGILLFQKKADEKMFPASLTKIATAYYILEKYPHLIDQKCLVSPEAIFTVSAKKKALNDYQTCPSFILESDGCMIDLKQGERISLFSLVHALLIASGNDAANVMAYSLEKDIQQFIFQLNEFVKEKGCKDTHFCNPHGLHHPEHLSTANDLAKLTKAALNNPYFAKIVATEKYILPMTNKQAKRQIIQTNKLIRKEEKDYYPFASGVKTGYTSFAGYNLIASAEKKGRSLTAVLLGYDCPEKRYSDAKRLFEVAFREKKMKKLILKKEKCFAIQIEGANDILEASLKGDLFLEYYPSEEVAYKAFLKWKDLFLPIKKGSIVGKVKLQTKNGIVLTSADLYAKKDINKSFFYRIKEIIQGIFSKK